MNEYICEICGKKFYTARLMQDLIEQGEDKCDCGGKLYLNEGFYIKKSTKVNDKFYK